MSDERTADEFALDLRVETEPPLVSNRHITLTGTAPADHITATGTVPVG